MIYLEPLQVRASKRNLLLFKLFSSPELKAQVSFSDNFLSVVCLSTFHIFIFFSRTTGPISTKLGTNHPFKKGIQVCSNEWPHPFRKGDNSKTIKIILKNLKNFIFRTTGSISTKLGTKHAWVVVIQVCSNEGPHPSPSGYNIEIVKCALIYLCLTLSKGDNSI